MGRIVVVGSYNRDTVLRVPRFPQPGETLAAAGMARFHGGKGSNQAVAAARAGATVAMVAAIGADAPGRGRSTSGRRNASKRDMSSAIPPCRLARR